jgi:hypothetical protein
MRPVTPGTRRPRVVQDLQANDMARVPWSVRRYAQRLPRAGLPRSLPPTTAPAPAVLAGTADVALGTLDLAQLSRLLYRPAGVVRTTGRAPRGRPAIQAAINEFGPLP